MSSPKKPNKQYDLEYKRRIVQEYLQGGIKSAALAEREGIERGQIYKWKIQLDNLDRAGRIEEIADTQGVSVEQARRIRELEEELEATQKKLAKQVVYNELLEELVKKTDPNSAYARRSSSYADIKLALARSKGRAK
jgi:transposase-like protein